MDRLHPRRQLFFERTRKKSEFLPHRDRGPGDHQASEFTVHHCSLEARGHRKQRLASTSLAHQCYQFDPIIEQRIEAKMLLAVPRLDAPDSFAAIDNWNQLRS